MKVIFHQAALGDFALILPLLRGLEQPASVVCPWSRGRLAAGLIEGLGAVDIELFEFTRLHAPGGPSTLSPAVAELFEQAEAVISFVAEPGGSWAENVKKLTPKAELIFLPTRPTGPSAHDRRGQPRHVTEVHAQLLRERGIELSAEPVAVKGDPAGPWVVHPGSGGRDKCWPAERMAELVDRLRDDGREVRVVYGEAEAQRWTDAQRARWVEGYGAQGCGSLAQLTERLAGAAGFLGNDAGPTQLAAQLGLPTVALFGPSDPRVWAPRGPAVTVIAPETPRGMAWLEVERVAEAVRSAAGPGR